MAANSEELKSCPFCGDQEIGWLRSQEGELIWTGLECRSCMATLKWFESRSQTIAAWNRRAPDPSLTASLEAARAALGAIRDARVRDEKGYGKVPATRFCGECHHFESEGSTGRWHEGLDGCEGKPWEPTCSIARRALAAPASPPAAAPVKEE